MRVLHFISSPAAGGAETYVRDLSILMRRHGHEVHIVFLQSAAESGRDPDFEKMFLNSLADESIGFSFIGKEARRKFWLGARRLRLAVKDFQPDVIHCHLYYALLFSFFIFKVPVLYTHHNIKLGLPKAFYRIFDFRVSAYIAICSACKEKLKGGNRSVIKINNAVSKNRILVKKSVLNAEDKDVVFIFLGRLSEQKNLPLLLNSFGALKNSNVHLLIAGEGPDKTKLQHLAHTLGVSDKLTFLGNVSNVGEVLEKSDVFVMSSAWEGLPISLIEATLTGLPVIVTNVGGCAEVVHQCANGFVVDDLNAESYSAALRKMVENAELRAFFSRNSLAFSGMYEIEESLARHLQVYKQTIEHKRN